MNRKSEMCKVFAENMEPLFRLSYLITGDEILAEDCFSRALQAATGSATTVAGSEFLLSWARRVMVKISIQSLFQGTVLADGKRALSANSQQLDLSVLSTLPAFSGSSIEMADFLREDLLRLAPIPRVAFILRYLEQLSKKDAALLLDLSLDTLNQALKVAAIELSCHLYPRVVSIREQAATQTRLMAAGVLQPCAS